MLSKELIGAATRPLLLSILEGGESYGYAIIHRLRTISGDTVDWKDGTLYPVLHRLEEDGLIASTWRTADNGRRRKYYSLTAAGKKALARERRQWLQMDAILAGLWGLEPRTAI